MTDPDVADFLSAWPDPVVEIALWICDLVLAVAPDARVSVKRGWQLIGFHTPRYTVAVAPRVDHCLLYFEHGARLPDPDALFEMKGRQQIATIRVDGLDQPGEAALRRYIERAVDLG